jgi:hypothetical protein
VLKISGRPYRAIASSSASRQNSTSMPFDNRQAGTRLVAQSSEGPKAFAPISERGAVSRPRRDRRQIKKAAPHRDVGDIRAPSLVRPVDGQIAQQIRPDSVFGMRHRGPWPLVDGFESHLRHQPTDALAPNDVAQPTQVPRHLSANVPRRVEKLLPISRPGGNRISDRFNGLSPFKVPQ